MLLNTGQGRRLRLTHTHTLIMGLQLHQFPEEMNEGTERWQSRRKKIVQHCLQVHSETI